MLAIGFALKLYFRRLELREMFRSKLVAIRFEDILRRRNGVRQSSVLKSAHFRNACRRYETGGREAAEISVRCRQQGVGGWAVYNGGPFR